MTDGRFGRWFSEKNWQGMVEQGVGRARIPQGRDSMKLVREGVVI